MQYDKSSLLPDVAAEYVIGTLRGGARQRFEKLLETDAVAQAQVAFWEQRLSEFGEALEPLSPPEESREAILSMTRPAVSSGSLHSDKNASSSRFSLFHWLSRGFGAYASGVATATLLFMAIALFWRQSDENTGALVGESELPSEVNAVTYKDGTGPFPFYSAQLKAAASSMRWMISISPDHKEFSVIASDDFLQVGRHTVQLWGMTSDNRAISLGPLPNRRDASITFKIPNALRGRDDVRFVISLEGAAGATQDRPTGSVLDEAKALDSI